jgi:hypothetical protein
MPERTARPMPGTEPTPLVLKPRKYDHPQVETTVLIQPTQFGIDEIEVYLSDGTWIGTIGKYTGTLDRKIKGTRLRHIGKRRTLWHYNGTGDGRAMYGQTSRADCIRSLIRNHEWRSRR